MAAVSAELMEILRCPVAVHYSDKGDDPGRLRLVKDSWLVCDDSGYKYPIRDGIPGHAGGRRRQVAGHR